MKLLEYLKSKGYVSATKVVGPMGAFISATKRDSSRDTLPVGKRSQNGSLAQYNVLITEDGTAIATVNEYRQVETVQIETSPIITNPVEADATA